jgi:hypothetical protein
MKAEYRGRMNPGKNVLAQQIHVLLNFVASSLLEQNSASHFFKRMVLCGRAVAA